MSARRPEFVVGDYWESPGGMGFTITSVDDDVIGVDVERNVRNKDGRKAVEVRAKKVPRCSFATFARAYRKQKRPKA